MLSARRRCIVATPAFYVAKHTIANGTNVGLSSHSLISPGELSEMYLNACGRGVFCW